MVDNNDSGLRVSARPRRAIALSLLSIGAMTAMVTAAVWTDSASVSGNTFSTGGVDISASPATSAVTMSGMAPGDSIVDDIVVSNDGTMQLRYALTSTTTGNDAGTTGDDSTLAAQLDMTVWDEAAESDAGVACAATPPGVVLYGPGDAGNTTGMAVFGSPTQGAQAGDRVLAAAATEVLCFRVSLPASSGNAFQNLTTTATFLFEAEQTANNP